MSEHCIANKHNRKAKNAIFSALYVIKTEGLQIKLPKNETAERSCYSVEKFSF